MRRNINEEIICYLRADVSGFFAAMRKVRRAFSVWHTLIDHGPKAAFRLLVWKWRYHRYASIVRKSLTGK